MGACVKKGVVMAKNRISRRKERTAQGRGSGAEPCTTKRGQKR